MIAEVEVRPDVYERHELLALRHRIRGRLASRDAVAWFSVHGLIMSEPAGTLVRVKGVARSGRSASAAVVRRAFSSGCKGRPASSALHSAMASSRSS
eukprot:473059-Pleurochrysis_carterae.AAC.1